MRIKKLRFSIWLLVSCSLATLCPGRLAILEVKDVVYRDVRVLSVNELSVSIQHSKGVSQIRLEDLDPELRSQFGYDPGKASERETRLALEKEHQVAKARVELQKAREAQLERQKAQSQSEVSLAFGAFGTAPSLRSEVDHRPRFRDSRLSVRDQGARPSCSVHSIIAALEYQYAKAEGRSVRISEKHLLSSTSRSLGQSQDEGMNQGGSAAVESIQDAGFALEEVFQAIRGFGLVFDSMDGQPFEADRSKDLGPARFSAYRIPGRQTTDALLNIVHALNAEIPVVIGLAWPDNWRLARTHMLSKQPPSESAGHAVTLVGYRCSNGDLASMTFIFRNSWGPKWGAAGYGFVTHEYLSQNLFSAYVVELQ